MWFLEPNVRKLIDAGDRDREAYALLAHKSATVRASALRELPAKFPFHSWGVFDEMITDEAGAFLRSLDATISRTVADAADKMNRLVTVDAFDEMAAASDFKCLDPVQVAGILRFCPISATVLKRFHRQLLEFPEADIDLTERTRKNGAVQSVMQQVGYHLCQPSLPAVICLIERWACRPNPPKALLALPDCVFQVLNSVATPHCVRVCRKLHQISATQSLTDGASCVLLSLLRTSLDWLPRGSTSKPVLDVDGMLRKILGELEGQSIVDASDGTAEKWRSVAAEILSRETLDAVLATYMRYPLNMWGDHLRYLRIAHILGVFGDFEALMRTHPSPDHGGIIYCDKVKYLLPENKRPHHVQRCPLCDEFLCSQGLSPKSPDPVA